MFRFIESKSYENITCGKISQKTIPYWQDCRSVLPLLGRFHSTCPRFVWRLVVYLAWHSNTGQSTANNTRTCICVMVQVLWQLISSLFCFLSKDCKHICLELHAEHFNLFHSWSGSIFFWEITVLQFWTERFCCISSTFKPSLY